MHLLFSPDPAYIGSSLFSDMFAMLRLLKMTRALMNYDWYVPESQGNTDLRYILLLLVHQPPSLTCLRQLSVLLFRQVTAETVDNSKQRAWNVTLTIQEELVYLAPSNKLQHHQFSPCWFSVWNLCLIHCHCICVSPKVKRSYKYSIL